MKIKTETNFIQLPEKTVLAATPTQNRLRIAMSELKEIHKFSRRDLHREIPQKIWDYNGVIALADGRIYPREQVFTLVGHESGKSISNFLQFTNGMPRYTPRSYTVPRLELFWLWIAIVAPEVAKDIIK